jgi:Flp pilus assembly protein TadB
VAKTLDSELKERLRAVLADRRVTEADLRKLAEEGRACALILGAQLAKREQALVALSADPASSLSEIAAAL